MTKIEAVSAGLRFRDDGRSFTVPWPAIAKAVAFKRDGRVRGKDVTILVRIGVAEFRTPAGAIHQLPMELLRYGLKERRH